MTESILMWEFCGQLTSSLQYSLKSGVNAIYLPPTYRSKAFFFLFVFFFRNQTSENQD